MKTKLPFSSYFMQGWIVHYQYHAAFTWWIFGATAMGAVIVTVLTVSIQAIKAAMANPVKSLRTE